MGTATWTSSPTSSTRRRRYSSATSPSDTPSTSSRSGYAGRDRTAKGWARKSPWCCPTADVFSKLWTGSRVTSPKATCPSISVSERRITRPRSRSAGHRGLVRRSAGPSPPEGRSRSWSRSGSLRRPDRARRFREPRSRAQEPHRLVRRAARLPQQCLELQLNDVRDLVPFVARRRRSPVAVEGHKVGQGALGPCPLAAPQCTEPEGEQVHRRIARTYSSQVDVPPQARAVPSLAVHDVFGAHLREHGAPAQALLRVAAHELEVALGGVVSALLHISVAH